MIINKYFLSDNNFSQLLINTYSEDKIDDKLMINGKKCPIKPTKNQVSLLYYLKLLR